MQIVLKCEQWEVFVCVFCCDLMQANGSTMDTPPRLFFLSYEEVTGAKLCKGGAGWTKGRGGIHALRRESVEEKILPLKHL